MNAIKGILEAGVRATPLSRMNLDLLRAVVVTRRMRKNCRPSIHTGDSQDVIDAIALGADLDRALPASR